MAVFGSEFEKHLAEIMKREESMASALKLGKYMEQCLETERIHAQIGSTLFERRMAAIMESERSVSEAIRAGSLFNNSIAQAMKQSDEIAKAMREIRSMRNLAAHSQDLSVDDSVDDPLAKPLIVDVRESPSANDHEKTLQTAPEIEANAFSNRMLLGLQPPSPPPGTRMRDAAALIFSDQDVERVFEPLIEDYRFEMGKAAQVGDTALQRSLRAQYRLRFVYAIALQLLSFFGRIFRASRGS